MRALLRVVLFPGAILGAIGVSAVWLGFANAGPLLARCPKRRT